LLEIGFGPGTLKQVFIKTVLGLFGLFICIEAGLDACSPGRGTNKQGRLIGGHWPMNEPAPREGRL
jgi:hypothetical protein